MLAGLVIFGVKESPGLEVIKLFMLNSADHEILNAHKYKNIKKFGFLGSVKHRMVFFPLIHVKMPTVVGILTFMSRKKSELSIKKAL